MSHNLTPEKIFIDTFKCPSTCQYKEYMKQHSVCQCICKKIFVAGYNKGIELKTKRNG